MSSGGPPAGVRGARPAGAAAGQGQPHPRHPVGESSSRARKSSWPWPCWRQGEDLIVRSGQRTMTLKSGDLGHYTGERGQRGSGAAARLAQRRRLSKWRGPRPDGAQRRRIWSVPVRISRVLVGVVEDLSSFFLVDHLACRELVLVVALEQVERFLQGLGDLLVARRLLGQRLQVELFDGIAAGAVARRRLPASGSAPVSSPIQPMSCVDRSRPVSPRSVRSRSSSSADGSVAMSESAANPGLRLVAEQPRKIAVEVECPCKPGPPRPRATPASGSSVRCAAPTARRCRRGVSSTTTIVDSAGRTRLTTLGRLRRRRFGDGGPAPAPSAGRRPRSAPSRRSRNSARLTAAPTSRPIRAASHVGAPPSSAATSTDAGRGDGGFGDRRCRAPPVRPGIPPAPRAASPRRARPWRKRQPRPAPHRPARSREQAQPSPVARVPRQVPVSQQRAKPLRPVRPEPAPPPLRAASPPGLRLPRAGMTISLPSLIRSGFAPMNASGLAAKIWSATAQMLAPLRPLTRAAMVDRVSPSAPGNACRPRWVRRRSGMTGARRRVGRRARVRIPRWPAAASAAGAGAAVTAPATAVLAEAVPAGWGAAPGRSSISTYWRTSNAVPGHRTWSCSSYMGS